jgi:hypothetical protein
MATASSARSSPGLLVAPGYPGTGGAPSTEDLRVLPIAPNFKGTVMSGLKTWSGGWMGRWLGTALAAGVVAGAVVATRPAAAAGKVKPKSWPLILWPAVGPARVIGSYGGACLAGAVPLPLQGPGYQAVSVSLRRYYGHPTLIDFIEDLGRIAVERNLGLLAISDLAQPRGGPMGSGHVSHQGGLDVDIWFRLDLPPCR